MTYVLKAELNNNETRYYMNIICVTGNVESAKHYNSKEEAMKDMQSFKNLFYYEEPKSITVEEVADD